MKAPFTVTDNSCAVFEPAAFNAIVSASASAPGGVGQLYVSDISNVTPLAKCPGTPLTRLTYALGHVFALSASHYHRIKVAGGAAAALPISEEHPLPLSPHALCGVQKDVFAIGVMDKQPAMLLRFNVPSQDWSVVMQFDPDTLALAEAKEAELVADYAGSVIYLVKQNAEVLKITNITSEGAGKADKIAAPDEAGAGPGPVVFVNVANAIYRQRHNQPGFAVFDVNTASWTHADADLAPAAFDVPLAFDRREKTLYWLDANATEWRAKKF